MIPFLQPLYDYSWAIGLVAGFIVYLAPARLAPSARPVVPTKVRVPG